MAKEKSSLKLLISRILKHPIKMLFVKNLRQALFLALIMAACLYMMSFFMLSNPNHQKRGIIEAKLLLVNCINLAIASGRSIIRIRELNNLNNSTVVKGKTKEGANEKLTLADLVSHLKITSGLKMQFPQLKIVSEEHSNSNILELYNDSSQLYNDNKYVENPKLQDIYGYVNLSEAIAWVDPLDATQEFTENLLNYVTVMICVVSRGRPIIGVVYKPFTEELYWSYVGPNGVSRISWFSPEYQADGKSEPEKPVIIVSRSHMGDVKQILDMQFKGKYRIVNAGGSGFKTISVIAREADAYVHTTAIKKWDTCAPDALITAMGGKMTTLNGDRIDYSSPKIFLNEDGLLVSRGRINSTMSHEEFLNEFRSSRDKFKSMIDNQIRNSLNIAHI